MQEQISEIQQRVARVETKQDIVIQMLGNLPCKEHNKGISDLRVGQEKGNTKIERVKVWTLLTIASLIISVVSLAASIHG